MDKQHCILIVDDEKFNIKVLTEFLHEDYRIMAAKTGEQALKAVQGSNPPDLILLDIMMPGIDGYEVCKRIKKDEKTSHIPIIFVTAVSEAMDAARAFEIGAVDYITKPFNPVTIKARVKTHIQLNHTLCNLEAALKEVKNLTKINRLQDRLARSERLAVTGQLAATIAHEINSPMLGIASLLSFLKKVYATDKKLFNNLETINNGFSSIKNTVNKLMNLSRPGKEKQQPTHINSVINDTISLVQFQMDKLGIKSNIHLASEMPAIYASPSQLGHVFLNLINNAMEAMTQVSLKKEITINSTIEENNIIITVHDTGPGVPNKDVAHIFNPFYSKKKLMGLGVGLSVCRRYIEDHKGSIRVENPPSGGALFTILLPVGCET